MGLFDLFRKRGPTSESAPEPPAEPAPESLPGIRRFGFDRERMFDIGVTQVLGGLFEVPREQRAGEWLEDFYDAAWWGSVELADPQVFVGPDGFPYLRLNVPRPDAPFESQCLANLATSCLEHGVGAAFFASPDDGPEAAQFVLSLGLVDSLVRYDSPDGDPVDLAESAGATDATAFEADVGAGSQALVVKEAHDVLIGTPSAEYLPPCVAAALAHHLEQRWGLSDPRVQLLVDSKMVPHRSLVIGRRRSELPEGEPVDQMAQALLWFLTPGRSIVLLPEDWSLDRMTPLREII